MSAAGGAALPVSTASAYCNRPYSNHGPEQRRQSNHCRKLLGVEHIATFVCVNESILYAVQRIVGVHLAVVRMEAMPPAKDSMRGSAVDECPGLVNMSSTALARACITTGQRAVLTPCW